MKIDKNELSKIDLRALSENIIEDEFKSYFLDECGKEHYKLLAYFSTKFENSLLLDVGTYKGCSSLALAYNSSNEVVSFDIVHGLKSLHDNPRNVSYIVDNILNEQYSWMIKKSPFIMLDTFHNGDFEMEFYNKIKKIGFSGLLMIDDIYLNTEMKNFWNQIELEKLDLSEFGHHSGTGLVKFKQ